MDLIFVVTRKCNLKCEHCPVERNDKNLSLENAKKTLDILFKKNKKRNLDKIRFFGGEPFLFLDKIKEIIEYTEFKFKKDVFFDITTNGSLLTNDALEYFLQKDNFELIISYHKDIFNLVVKKFFKKQVTFKKCTFNIKINPEEVQSLSRDFIYLYSKGVSRFNILPSYYTHWNTVNIDRLTLEFQKIILYIKLQGVEKFYLKNANTSGDVPLFNTAMVVDCDGSVFSNNIVLDSRLMDKQLFYLGNVRDNDIDFGKLDQVRTDLEKSLSSSFSKDILKSTRIVDDALTLFVMNFKNITGYEKNN